MQRFEPVPQEFAARKLASLRYRATAYEVALTASDGRQFVVCWSERKSLGTLASLMQRYADRILPLIDDSDADLVRGAFPAYQSPTWRFGFTGRTYRDMLAEGRLPRLPGGGR